MPWLPRPHNCESPQAAHQLAVTAKGVEQWLETVASGSGR